MTMTTEIRADTSGTLWKIVAQPNAPQAAGAPLAIIESMKMEIPVESPFAGFVSQFLVEEGSSVEEGEVIALYVSD